MKRPFPPIAIGSVLLLASLPTFAEQVIINSIIGRQYAEVRKVENDSWVPLSTIEGLHLPLPAISENGEIRFTVAGTDYAIARSTVELQDEVLLERGCQRVATAMRTDSRSAAIRGAGELCN